MKETDYDTQIPDEDDENTVLVTVQMSPASLLMNEGDEPSKTTTEPTELRIE